MKKRILSIILAAVFCLSLVPMGGAGYGDTSEAVEESPAFEAADASAAEEEISTEELSAEEDGGADAALPEEAEEVPAEEDVSSDEEAPAEEAVPEDEFELFTDGGEEPLPEEESAPALDGVIDSGTWGTGSIPWEIDDEGTLTIGDGNDHTVSGFVPISNSSYPWYTDADQIKAVTFTGSITLSDSGAFMFSDYTSLISVDLTNCSFTNTINTEHMFSGCTSLTTITGLAGMDTSSVTNMDNMFSGCSALTTLDDIGGWTTSSVTEMYATFNGCSSLLSLDLSAWDVSSVTNFGQMFTSCSSLTSLDLHGWDLTAAATSGTGLWAMFQDCSSLVTLDVSGWNTAGITNMTYMFVNCSSLKELDLSSSDTSAAAAVSGLTSMLSGLTSLQKLTLGTTTNITGSTFDSTETWCLESDFTTAMTADDVVAYSAAMTSATTFYAVWTVGFDADIGSGTMDAQYAQKFDTTDNFTLPASSFTAAAGTSFYQWDISGTRYESGDTASITADTTVTAIWGVTVNFLNYDSSVLETKTVEYNTVPAYTGTTPTRDATAQYTYTHSGWTPTLAAVTAAQDYTATFTETLRSYTITWQNDDGTVLETDTAAEYGTTPTYDSATPTKTATAEYTYTFDAWTPAVASVTGDATYTASFTSTANSYNVTYSYTGTVPGDATALPAAATYQYGTDVTVAAAATAAGYTFSGWSRADFTMPAEDVTITGSFTANGDTPYTVEHYQEALDGTYNLYETESLTGATAETATANQKTYEGFTFDSTVTGTVQTGTIAGDGSLTLKLYYTRNSYNVTYSYTGTVPAGATALPADASVKYGDSVTVAAAATAAGYTFSGWSRTGTFTMPAENVAITGSFSETPPEEFTISWDVNGTITTTSAIYGATPAYTGTTPAKDADDTGHYTFSGWDPAVTAVSGNATYTAQFTVAAHTWGTPVWTWAADHSSAAASFTCADCGYVLTVDAAVTNAVTTEAGCLTTGVRTYTASATAGGTTYTNDQTETIAALGHEYSEWTNDAAGHWHVCTRCGDTLHFAAHTSSGAATETTAETCTVCGYVITPELGHIHTNHLTYVAASSPTCTRNGNTAYYSCSCGRWFYDSGAAREITDRSAVTIAALGHSYSDEWTSSDAGHWHACTRCGAADQVRDHVSSGAPTVEHEETCTVCGRLLNGVITIFSSADYLETGESTFPAVTFQKTKDDVDEWTVTLPEEAPVMSGYWFEGWTTPLRDGLFTSGEDLTFTYTDVESISFTANWTRLIGIGTYDLEAGTRYRLEEGRFTFSGDDTVFQGGNYFYLPSDGTYTIS